MDLSNLSIVIPVYNEQERISASLDTILEYLANSDFHCEILIGDDGSDDNTVGVVNEYVEKHSNIHLFQYSHRGKGAVIKDTILMANDKYCFICDADLSMPITQLDRFLLDLDENDHILYGTRESVFSSRIGEPYFRYVLGRIFNFLTKLLLQINIKDTQCGFKCFHADAAIDLFTSQILDGMSFDVEVLYIARKRGYKIIEVPVDWYFHKETRVRMFEDSLRMLVDILVLRKNWKSGRYERKN